MKKEMLINVLQPEECRIAILENSVLEELYVERTSHESYVGNIYKGRIVNIEPSIQAAFVDFGVGRNGFLHVSDVEPAYYRHLEQRRGDRGGRHGNGRGRDRGRGESDRPRPPSRIYEDEPAPVSPPPDEVAEATPTVETPALEAAPPAWEEPAPAAEAPPAAPEAHAAEPPAAEPTEEAAPPLVALPETQIIEEPARGRRRSRGGNSRRRRGSTADASAEPAGEDAGAPEADDAPEGDDKPRLMDSAERRTTEHDPEVSPVSPDDGARIRDEDLFFPRSETRTPEPPRHAPEPQPASLPPLWEAGSGVSDEPPEELPPPPEPEARRREPEVRRPGPERRPRHEPGPRRSGPSRGRAPAGRSVEEDLEADLAAAEIGEDLMAEFEESYDDHFDTGDRDDDDDGVGADDGPPPRHREERRGPREGGRGDRRGPRDNRRGGPRRMSGGRPGFGRPKPLIQDIFRRGQEVLVQVIKEGIGTKGPTLSTYISIAGRYLVLMPGLNRVGVSRKIQDDDQRRRLREIFTDLKPPKGLGFVIRTAAIDKNKKELHRDLAYLSRLWEVVVRRIRKLKAPAEIYQESDMITRTIRDTFTSDIDTIWVDEPGAFEHAQEFMKIVMPRYASRIKQYEGKDPLFHRHGIEDEIARIQLRKVPLPMGGSIVIEQTEALVAIDVNSGNFRSDRQDAEETAYQMNLHAAKEIARQLRLRDLGGVIVNDFIDMRDDKHRRAVEKAMRDAVKRDRARTKILKISAFGIIEMTRQRIRPSLKRSVYQDCPYCHGMAQVKTCESMSIDVMRMLQLAAHRDHVHHIDIRVADDVANYLLNRKRREITKLEESGGIQVQVRGTPGAPPELLEFACYDNNNNEVKFLPTEDVPAPRGRRERY
jgi:ribonuclease E